MREMVNNDVLLFSEINDETPFIVTPSKNKNVNQSIPKVQNLGNERR